MDIGTRLVKNSIFNAARALIAVPLALFLVPFTLKHLGKSEYGIWSLVSVVSSYTQLSDFGITESLIKFIAEFKARGDVERLNQAVNTALVAYCVISIVFCSLFLFSLPFIVDTVLDIPSEFREESLRVFSIAILLFFMNLVTSVFGSLLQGFQRMEYSNGIAISSLILTAIGTVLVLNNGYGLTGLICVNAAITPLVIAANIMTARRLFPALQLDPLRYFSRQAFGTIAGFSWKVQISNITQLLVFQVDRVLLSHFLGLETVSLYDIANQIALQTKNIIAFVFNPMAPAASALHAEAENEKLSGLYARSFKYMSAVAIPLSLLVIALAHPFIRTWMGTGFDISAFTLQFLMAAYMINLLTGPGLFIVTGINKPHISMWSSVLAGTMNITLCYLFIRWIGYYGIMISIFITMLISGIFFLWMVHRLTPQIGAPRYAESIAPPFMYSGALCILYLILDIQIHFSGYFSLAGLGICYLAALLVILTQGNYFDDLDRSTFPILGLVRLRKS